MAQANKKHISIAIGCFLLFILVSILSSQNQLVILDQSIISWSIESSSPSFITIMEGVSKVGSGEIIIILSMFLGVFLLIKRMWGQVILLGSLTVGGIALNFFLKVLFQRERPGEMSVIEVFGYSLEIASYSFPSGHTMRSVILFSFLIYLSYHLMKNDFKKMALTVLLGVMIIAVALSRIYIGAHFPSDIFAAITISIAWFYFCLLILRYLLKNKLAYF